MLSTKSLPTLFIQAALIATATVLAIVLVSKFVSPIPLAINQVTTQKDAAFVASGKSSISTQPDQAGITLGFARQGNDIKSVQTAANTVINSLTTQLTNLGISKDNIKTQNYSITPTYDYQKSSQSITGYSVDVSLSVDLKEQDFDKLSKVIDLATAAGANQVGGIQFTLSDQKEKDVRKQAREQAINDAKQSAQELANLSGLKLGKIINVTEAHQNQPQPMPMLKAMDATQAGNPGATSIQPGSTVYNYSVTLSYETL